MHVPLLPAEFVTLTRVETDVDDGRGIGMLYLDKRRQCQQLRRNRPEQGRAEEWKHCPREQSMELQRHVHTALLRPGAS
jgi:hypothetical protein